MLSLLSGARHGPWSHELATLTDLDALADDFREIGVPVTAFGMARGRIAPLRLIRLWRWIVARRPALLQTWMYHADLVGGLAGARLGASTPVVWNVRTANLDPGVVKVSTRAVARACAALSARLPERIVVNSRAGRELHARLGYDASRLVVIPNGVDTDRFRPDPGARARLAAELGIPEEAPLVGHVGNYRPAKDHATFLDAAARILERVSEARFVLIGQKVNSDNPALAGRIERTADPGRFHLLGERDDVPQLLPALDVLASSSRREGFPNAVAEAVASGVPCAVTDVGDAAWIVGNTGAVVEPGDAEGLAAACVGMLELPLDRRLDLRNRARVRATERFGIEQTIQRYVSLWESLLDDGARSASAAR